MSNFLWICSKRTKTCDFPVWIWSYIFGSLSRSLATNNWILQTAPVPPRDGRHIHDLTWTDLMPSTSHTKNWSELIQAKTGRVVFLYIDSESSVFTKKLFVCLGDIQTKTLQGWTWFFWVLNVRLVGIWRPVLLSERTSWGWYIYIYIYNI